MYSVDVYLRVRRAVMVERRSIREASRVFGLHQDTVSKMVAYSVLPGFRRNIPPGRLKLEAYTGIIEQILDDDHHVPKKQPHLLAHLQAAQGRGTASTADTPSSRTTAMSTAAGHGIC